MKLCDCSYSLLTWSINEKINAYIKSYFISILTNQSEYLSYIFIEIANTKVAK